MKILLADDEQSLREALAIMLEKSGYRVFCAEDGEAAMELFVREHPDVIVVDIMMPKLDGFEVCDAVRKIDRDVPILILSAKSDIVDKKVGFKSGADDYLTKPFSEEELLLRVEALARRSSLRSENASSSEPQTIRAVCGGDLRIDLRRCEISVKGEVVALTLKEFQILALMSESPGKVFSREELAQKIWGKDYDPRAVGVPVYIRHIREKIEDDPSEPRYLQTAWRFGYRLGN